MTKSNKSSNTKNKNDDLQIKNKQNIFKRCKCRLKGINNKLKLIKDIFIVEKKPKNQPLSEKEKEIIKKNTDKTAREIGEMIGRKPSTILGYCRRNNINIKKGINYLNDVEKEFIHRNREKITYKEMADLLGRNPKTIKNYIEKNNKSKYHK